MKKHHCKSTETLQLLGLLVNLLGFSMVRASYLYVVLLSRPQAEKNTYTAYSKSGVYGILSPSLFFFRNILYTNACRSVVFHVYRIPMQYTTNRYLVRISLSFFLPFFPSFFFPFFFLFFSLPLSSVHQYQLSISLHGSLYHLLLRKIKLGTYLRLVQALKPQFLATSTPALVRHFYILGCLY